MIQRIAVSSADFIRNIGRWQQEALQHPIVITHHGRERLVLAATDRVRLDAANESFPDASVVREVLAAHEALLAHMEEGCLTFSADGAIASVNEAAAEFLGRAEQELTGRQLTAVMADLLSLIIMDRVTRVWRTRSAEQFEADAADGRHLSFRVYPTANAVTVLFNNTTETVRLQRELEDSRALAGAVQTHSEAAVLRLDPRGRIEAVDSAFCAWTGFNAADLTGHRLTELVAGEERRELTLFLEHVMRAPAGDQRRAAILGRSGLIIPCVLSMAPIVSDFVPRGVVVMAVKSG